MFLMFVHDFTVENKTRSSCLLQCYGSGNEVYHSCFCDTLVLLCRVVVTKRTLLPLQPQACNQCKRCSPGARNLHLRFVYCYRKAADNMAVKKVLLQSHCIKSNTHRLTDWSQNLRNH